MAIHDATEDAQCSYELYVALHRSYHSYPHIFTLTRCAGILTSIMGGRSWSWQVVGITPAALKAFRDAAYKKVRGITRAHIQSRAKTTRALLEPEEPLSKEEFADIWVANDKTVLCAPGENKDTVPDYIRFEDLKGGLFPSAYVGWRHGPLEREYLVSLSQAHQPLR